LNLKGEEVMKPNELTEEDWKELYEIFEREEVMRLSAEEEERECARVSLELQYIGHPAQESEFDDSDEEEYQPD